MSTDQNVIGPHWFLSAVYFTWSGSGTLAVTCNLLPDGAQCDDTNRETTARLRESNVVLRRCETKTSARQRACLGRDGPPSTLKATHPSAFAYLSPGA